MKQTIDSLYRNNCRQQHSYCLQTVRVAELVHQPLRSFCLLHDTLLVVLANRSRQFVIIHGWPVLAFAPQSCHTDGVLYLEDALAAVQPADAGAMELR